MNPSHHETRLTYSIDIICSLLSVFSIPWLERQLSRPRLTNALFFMFAYVLFCGMLWMIRKMPHDIRLTSTYPEQVSPLAAWLCISIFIFSGMLFVGGMLTSVEQSHERMLKTTLSEMSSFTKEFLSYTLSTIVLVLFCLPSVAFFAMKPKALENASSLLKAKAFILIASHVCFQVMIVFWESLMMRYIPEGVTPPWYAGIAACIILVPIFLLVCGAPRLMLTFRQFSWASTLSLLASTSWYILSTYKFIPLPSWWLID